MNNTLEGNITLIIIAGSEGMKVNTKGRTIHPKGEKCQFPMESSGRETSLDARERNGGDCEANVNALVDLK